MLLLLAHPLVAYRYFNTIVVQPVTWHSPPAVRAPHHALVFYLRTFCSGSLISSRIVLTVASCFEKITEYNKIYVKFGCKETLEEGQIIPVVEIKTHEYFRYKSELDNDIALLVLQENVRFNWNVQKIFLFEPESVLPEFSYLAVTGWGTTESSKTREKYILKASMSLISLQECFDAYSSILTASMFCARYDSANRLSDNGGAAVYDGLVVGISSYGTDAVKKPFVALFTNVTYFYRWIKLNTERLLTKYCSDEDEQLHTSKYHSE